MENKKKIKINDRFFAVIGNGFGIVRIDFPCPSGGWECTHVITEKKHVIYDSDLLEKLEKK